MEIELTLDQRAERHAALGDPVRLAVIDRLTASDYSPQELRHQLDVPSNLLSHHLEVLERAGLILRGRSSGDGRRRYVHLLPDALADLVPRARIPRQPALFLCTANSARSQLAAALWTDIVGEPAASAGTHPAPKVHRGAVAAARRAGIDLAGTRPTHIREIDQHGLLTVTVCDRAHEELGGEDWLHWSVPDPVPEGTAVAFDRTVSELRSRILHLTAPCP